MYPASPSEVGEEGFPSREFSGADSICLDTIGWSNGVGGREEWKAEKFSPQATAGEYGVMKVGSGVFLSGLHLQKNCNP